MLLPTTSLPFTSGIAPRFVWGSTPGPARPPQHHLRDPLSVGRSPAPPQRGHFSAASFLLSFRARLLQPRFNLSSLLGFSSALPAPGLSPAWLFLPGAPPTAPPFKRGPGSRLRRASNTFHAGLALLFPALLPSHSAPPRPVPRSRLA